MLNLHYIKGLCGEYSLDGFCSCRTDEQAQEVRWQSSGRHTLCSPAVSSMNFLYEVSLFTRYSLICEKYGLVFVVLFFVSLKSEKDEEEKKQKLWTNQQTSCKKKKKNLVW